LFGLARQDQHNSRRLLVPRDFASTTVAAGDAAMRAMIRNQKQSPMILALQQRQHIDLFDRRTPSNADF
jgi:hypothetical protein